MASGRAPLGVVFWDYDDTVISSSEPWLEAWKVQLAELGIHLGPRFWSFVSMTNSHPGAVLQERFGVRLSKREQASLREGIMDRIRSAGLMPGVAALLDSLGEAGIVQVVVTNGSRKWLQETMPSGIRHRFSAVHTDAGKPADTAFVRMLKLLSADPEAAVGIDDAPWGIAALQSCGIAPLFVPSSLHRDVEFPGVLKTTSLEGVSVATLSKARELMARGPEMALA